MLSSCFPNKMCFRRKYRYRYWKILQYLNGILILPQYFSTFSIDIDIAVLFRYLYSLLFFSIGKNTSFDTAFSFHLIHIHANEEIDATKLSQLKYPRTILDYPRPMLWDSIDLTKKSAATQSFNNIIPVLYSLGLLFLGRKEGLV